MGSGARRDSFPRAICASDALSHLLPSHGDSNPSCSTGRVLNRGAAAPKDPGGIRLRSVSGTPRSARTPGAPSPQPPPWGCGHRGMLHCHCHTSSLSAQLLFSGSMEIRIQHHPGASASPPTPVPPPPAPAVTSCRGIRRDKGNVFMENLHPIEIFWERSARTASCHAMNLVHPELRDSPACPAKGFQSCTPRPRPRLCTPTPPCPCVSLSHPVAPRTLRVCAHPSLDLWGLGGDQEPITSPLAVPSHPPLLGVLCHLCKYLCVPSCVPAVLG